MKGYLTPAVAILFLLLAPFFSKPVDVNVSEYYWMTTFTYRVMPGELAEGEHTFQFNFEYASPEPGGLEGQLRTITVSSQTKEHLGYALIRPNGVQALVDSRNGLDCKLVKQIHPDQPAKFLVAWVADEKMTRDEVVEHIKSMIATVSIDQQAPIQMKAEEVAISWDALWNCRPHAFTTDLIEAGRLVR